ncbi:DnaJ C-terminal domain-containing protein [Acinetobacter sp. MD2]|uniref:DnaJ C-terminal domain-containing protein n=1 Tax=Acinetobacter sp. MD2 TaxID=2600066 RepID=UPI002D1F4217|nr:DnaJ C-terminal domain-containing protein [Acinetobacter sp. MD2]MEB3767007.1 DnaJ domain-containing protein [Acinetobacter sp. MD2]
MSKNYYEELGINRSATADEIKKAYRKLARKYHPDISKESDAEAKMQAINVAYDTLSHTEKKAEYDHMLDHPQGFSGNNYHQAGGFDENQFYRQNAHQNNQFHGFEDLFGRFGTGFGGAKAQHQQFKGEDQHAQIEIPVEIAYQGATQQITLQIPSYNAYGQPEVQRKTLEVKIPKGMKQGQQIRLSGQGQLGVNGGANGDLYLEVHYQENEQIRVEGADIYLTTPISPWEAALGKTINVNTPSGQLQVNLPKNAKYGQQLRLKDKGIPSQIAGHLYLILNIVCPTANNEQQTQAYQQFSEQFPHFNPRQNAGD